MSYVLTKKSQDGCGSFSWAGAATAFGARKLPSFVKKLAKKVKHNKLFKFDPKHSSYENLRGQFLSIARLLTRTLPRDAVICLSQFRQLLSNRLFRIEKRPAIDFVAVQGEVGRC